VLLTTSTSPQPSNGKVTAASDQEGENEKTEERYDVIKYGMNKTVQLLPKVRHRFDNCSDIRHPSINISSEAIKNALLDIKNRGVKSRFITEITKDNLHSCKELMEVISELRHIDGVKGNFAVTDTEYVSYAIPSEKAIPSQKEKVVVIRSTSKEFVEQQQYLFDILWNKAVPAEHKIMEMESGIMLPERTEIITGADNIHRLTLASAPHIRESLDTSIDSNAPRSLTSGFMWNYMKELASTKKGVRFRYIAEITKDNLPYCKEMAKVFELRHLDGIKGNLSIIDGREYRASPSIRPGAPPDVLIRSTSKVFVEQQQFFFETLWNKALPAEKRIREIEEGIKPEIIETIRDPKVTQERVIELIKSANEEILIIFSTSNAFRRQVKAGTIDLIIRTAKSKNVKVRILSPFDDHVTNLIDKIKRENRIRIEIRNIEEPLQTKVSVLIVDRASLLSAELKSDSKETSLEAIGLATYSNSKETVLSYASIFESLWNQTELYEETRRLYQQLKSHDKMKQEFMDIAAHELRTPIQPILGLAQVLKNQVSDSSQIKFLDVILRNAKRLEQLQEDMLDVTRIESGSMKLYKELFNLNEFIFNVLQDFRIQLKDDARIKLNYRSDGDVWVVADKNRIIQVISNLLANAIKFTIAGRILVELRKRKGKKIANSNQVIVSIKDEGPGIDPSIIPRLFTKFASKSEKGTGLGLFISKSIIEAHGGKIWAKNNRVSQRRSRVGGIGDGAIFSFSLPVKLSQ
jgi:Histidine kinase-, DNA gyrase B-, and HSP90-like ATPase/His Kinase A (phospho-acceptor) domain